MEPTWGAWSAWLWDPAQGRMFRARQDTEGTASALPDAIIAFFIDNVIQATMTMSILPLIPGRLCRRSSLAATGWTSSRIK